MDSLLSFQGKKILRDSGSVSNAQMEQIAYRQYELFATQRKKEALLKAEKENKERLESIYKILNTRAEND